MQLSDESLIQLGAAILENPTNPRYADKLESSKVLGALAQWFIDEMSSGLPWRINNLLRQPYAFGLLNAIMGNRFTPSHLLADIYSILSRSSYRDCNYLLYTLAKNPATPSDVLSALGSSRYPTYIRSAVAGNLNTPPATLISLSTSPSKYIRIALAKNPASPEDVLRRMAISANRAVLKSLASHPRLPEQVIWVLLDNNNCNIAVYSTLIDNPALPKQLFDILVDTALRILTVDDYHRYYAVMHERDDGQRIYMKASLQAAILSSPRLGTEKTSEVISIIRSKQWVSPLIKTSIARNPHTPDSFVLELMFDEDKEVRQAAAEAARARHLTTISDDMQSIPKEVNLT